MSVTINFNTGRKYSAHGQRITATKHDDGVVTFFDHDRMIDGEFQPEPGCNFGQSLVMTAYGIGGYSNTARSWADGMQRGGCNSQYAGK